MSAVAVWVPPGSGEMGLGRMVRVGLATMPIRLGMGGSRRFMQALSATEPFHKSVHDPHWYLVAVGARSECQGQALGSAGEHPDLVVRLIHGVDEDVARYDVPPQVSEDFERELSLAGYDVTLTLVDGASHSVGFAGVEQFDSIVEQTLNAAETT